MDDNHRGESVCIGLLALMWDSLERFSVRLEAECESSREALPDEHLYEVRLELVLWRNAARELAGRAYLSADTDRVLGELMARVDDMITPSSAAAGTLHRQICHVQDEIYEHIQSTRLADRCARRTGVIEVSATLCVA